MYVLKIPILDDYKRPYHTETKYAKFHFQQAFDSIDHKPIHAYTSKTTSTCMIVNQSYQL